MNKLSKISAYNIKNELFLIPRFFKQVQWFPTSCQEILKNHNLKKLIIFSFFNF